MKKFFLLCMTLFICLLANAQATDLVIDCQTPGSLSSLINYYDRQSVKNLKVIGNINKDDLKFIGTLMQNYNLKGRIDLYDTSVLWWNYGRYNFMTSNSFDLTKMVHISYMSLPKELEDSEFILSKNTNIGQSLITVDTLYINWKNNYIKGRNLGGSIKHLELGQNIDSIPDPEYYHNWLISAFQPVDSLKSIKLPKTFRYLGNGSLRSIESVNIKDLEMIEYIGSDALAYFCPDTIIVPKTIRDPFYLYSFGHKNGQHIFIGDNIRQVYGDTKNNYDIRLIFHIDDIIPPSLYLSSDLSRNNLKNSILYVPKGAKQAYQNSDWNICQIIENNPVTRISLSQHSIILNKEEKLLLSVTITPEDADDQRISWNSSNIDVVAVDENGNITAIAPGEAKIYAVSVATGIKDSCLVTVRKNVETINFTESQIVLANIGDSKKLEYIITPNDATEKAITWKSSNEQVCTVSDSGLVTATGPGTAIITVTTVDGGHTATCTVKVIQHVTGLTLEKHVSTLKVGEQELMRASISPDNADDKTVKWTSSNNQAAIVDSNGNVTAKKAGDVWIKAVSNDNAEAKDSCKLTVIQPVTGVSLSKENITFNYAGDKQQLTATITPADASNKDIRWSSTNDNVCVVNNGLVTAVGAGTASVTVTTVDGNYSASCIVKVTQHVANISLNKSTLSLKVGKSERLSAIVTPDDAENKAVSWTSSNSQVAFVDANGNVTALKAGEAWIKAVSNDNTVAKDSCKVSVIQPVTGIRVTPETYRMTNIGENIQLEVTVLPTDATNKEVKWTSTNEAICMVANGKVIATGFGTAVVLATTTDGGFTASCAIVVEKESVPVTSIEISQTSAKLQKGETLQLSATVKPNNATNKNVVWKSSNESICIVSQSGLLVGLNEGSAIITVVPENGIGQAQCVVSVEERVNAITNINETTGDNVAIYDLMGQKVTHLIKGRIYICKGKKFVAR